MVAKPIWILLLTMLGKAKTAEKVINIRATGPKRSLELFMIVKPSFIWIKQLLYLNYKALTYSWT